MTKQEFIDIWYELHSYSYTPDIDGFTKCLEELLAETEDIEYQRGFQKGWKEGKENCNDLIMQG